MLLNLTVADKNNSPRGTAQMKLDFRNKEWAILPGQQPGWAGVGYSARGAFQQVSKDVLWIWDQRPGERNTVILWNPPQGEDDMNRSGQARIFDPKDPFLKEGKIAWEVAATVPPTPAVAATASGLTPIRDRILAIIKGIPFDFAPKYKLEFPSGPPKGPDGKPLPPPDYAVGNKVTNCGEFPGWVARNLGGQGAPQDVLKFQFKDKWGTYALTAPMTGWDVWAKKLELKRDREASDPYETVVGTLWVDRMGTKRPKPGDIYILVKENKLDFAHVGIIFNSDGDTWTTADCGQGGGYAGCYQLRKYDQASDSLIMQNPVGNQPDGGLRYLKGWVDVDALFSGWRPK